jgi:hypothetical protein
MQDEKHSGIEEEVPPETGRDDMTAFQILLGHSLRGSIIFYGLPKALLIDDAISILCPFQYVAPQFAQDLIAAFEGQKMMDLP